MSEIDICKRLSENQLTLVDKPKGMTSFDVIRVLRKRCNIRKMGHGGTLDPLATGLLIVGVGAGTKQLHGVLGMQKEYEAEIFLGIRTETGDMEGKILEEKEVKAVDEKKIKEAIASMEGTLELPVSIYSAIKRDGVALYKRARRGEDVDPPKKEMKVYRAEFIEVSPVENGRVTVRITFEVGSGTYIRSLAEELGRRLGYPATLKNLRRTKIGDYKIEDAIAL